MSNIQKNLYTMPAEWEPHSAIWLSWPHDEISFPERVEKVEKAVSEIILAIHKSEKVELLVLDEKMQKKAEKILLELNVDLNLVSFRLVDYMDGWMRDCGPIFVKDSSNQTAITNWIYNVYGGKFPELLIDDKLPGKINEWLKMPIMHPKLVLEGGAIEVNGQGICLTTEQCVLNENRNIGKTKKDVEKYFEEYLGIKKTIWLWKGLVNDHTDGHIDELSRFVSSNKILCAYEDDPNDENYVILKNNFETLETATNLEGKPFEIIKLPMPHIYFKDNAPGTSKGEKAPVSYANFYIGNKVILVSLYNDPNDQKALEIIQSCFPDRKAVGIDCSDIIYGGGAIHCMTMQQPK